MAQGQNPFDTPQYAVGGRFDTVARRVLGIEGGFVHDPVDHGGATNHGISLRFLKAEGAFDLNRDGRLDLDLDFDGDLDEADIRGLTGQQAMNLFYQCFWLRNRLDRLPAPIDSAVFDQAVNGGAVAAIKMLQTSINNLRLTDPLAVDGSFGAKTIAAVTVVQRVSMLQQLLYRYRMAAEQRYVAIAARYPAQHRFLAGWVARARGLGNV